jgi:hypothetical protein
MRATTRVARVFLVLHTKTGKISQIITKYTKCPKNIPNGCKLDQCSKNVPTSSTARPSKNYSNVEKYTIWQPWQPQLRKMGSILSRYNFGGFLKMRIRVPIGLSK